MKRLCFESGSGVRLARFEERSLLPVSAACLVANAMRERLGTLCRADIDLRLWPPAIPQPAAWPVIFEGANVFVVRGSRSDAAVVLRPFDACALAGLLFGETAARSEAAALSRLETEITRRAVERLAPALASACGETRLDIASSLDAVTYFELHVLSPVSCSIGIALAREPQSAVTTPLRAAALSACAVATHVEITLASVRAHDLARLKPGDLLEARDATARLCANGRTCASGTCGVVRERYAFRVGNGA